MFDAHLYSRGGWRCDPIEEQITYWRVDTDIDGSSNDLIEHTDNFSMMGSYLPNTTEFNEGYDSPLINAVWRTRDTITNNHVLTLPGFRFTHPDGNPVQGPVITDDSIGRFQGQLYKASEDIGLPLNLPVPGINNENINSKDVLTWFSSSIMAGYYRLSPVGAKNWSATGLSLIPNWTQKLPDVIVNDATFSDDGRFNIGVRNIGTATPSGKAVAVGIYIDGVYKTYANTLTPLFPGERRNLINSSLNKLYVPSGNHTVTFWVDDVNRFAEANESNNKLILPTAIIAPTVTITSPSKNATVSGTAVNLSATASNSASPIQGVTFYVDDVPVGNKASPPYSLSWNSATVSQGLHTLRATASDSLNRRGSDGIVFTVAPTIAPKPDIVVTSLSYANGKFSSTIKNQGAGNIPAGAFIGIGYFVDGVEKTWTTTFGPVAAGASVSLDVSKGGLYTISAGTHTIKVVADDQSSVTESNETNNQLSQTITVP